MWFVIMALALPTYIAGSQLHCAEFHAMKSRAQKRRSKISAANMKEFWRRTVSAKFLMTSLEILFNQYSMKE